MLGLGLVVVAAGAPDCRRHATAIPNPAAEFPESPGAAVIDRSSDVDAIHAAEILSEKNNSLVGRADL
jgi:hypothetical protein